MRRGAVAAAFGIAALLAGLTGPTATAGPPTDLAIQIVPTPGPPCFFGCGTWTASGAINDSGTYVLEEIASSPPNRPFLAPGPFRETLLLTSSSGSFTIKAEERQITPTTTEGVFQLEAGTGTYASASGHGDTSLNAPPLILVLTGVAKTD